MFMQENNNEEKKEFVIEELPNENVETKTESTNNVENKTEVTTSNLENKINNAVDAITKPKELTSEFTLDQVKYAKKYAYLCYIPFLFIYPYITKRYIDNAYMKHHVNQGIDLTVFTIIAFILDNALINIFREETSFGAYVPGWVGFFGYFITVIIVAYCGFGIWSIHTEKTYELPLIGKFKYLK